jgi:hypothetical protein
MELSFEEIQKQKAFSIQKEIIRIMTGVEII